MELNDITKIITKEYKINRNTIYVKNISWVPFLEKKGNVFNIYLDFKLANLIIKIVKKINNKCEFYFKSPILTNPKINIDEHTSNIRSYLYANSKANFFDGFKKINFDIIDNMILYCDKHNCFTLVKSIHSEINIEVQSKYFDFYIGRDIFKNNREDIREYYRSLYLDIKIRRLLS